MYRTAILKNDSTAEKRIEEEAFALASIAHYCFVETKTNCVANQSFIQQHYGKEEVNDTMGK